MFLLPPPVFLHSSVLDNSAVWFKSTNRTDKMTLGLSIALLPSGNLIKSAKSIAKGVKTSVHS